MKKTEKLIRARHLNEEIPLKILITEDPHIEKSKSGFEVSLYTDYCFECNLNNTYFCTNSRDDASIAFNELKTRLESLGYVLKCCGNCLNFYVDSTARNWYGGLWGFCYRGQEWEKARSQKNIKHCVNYCNHQLLREDVDYAVFNEN